MNHPQFLCRFTVSEPVQRLKDETGDVQYTVLVLRDGVWGNGGSMLLASLVCFFCNYSS